MFPPRASAPGIDCPLQKFKSTGGTVTTDPYVLAGVVTNRLLADGWRASKLVYVREGGWSLRLFLKRGLSMAVTIRFDSTDGTIRVSRGFWLWHWELAVYRIAEFPSNEAISTAVSECVRKNAGAG